MDVKVPPVVLFPSIESRGQRGAAASRSTQRRLQRRAMARGQQPWRLAGAPHRRRAHLRGPRDQRLARARQGPRQFHERVHRHRPSQDGAVACVRRRHRAAGHATAQQHAARRIPQQRFAGLRDGSRLGQLEWQRARRAVHVDRRDAHRESASAAGADPVGRAADAAAPEGRQPLGSAARAELDRRPGRRRPAGHQVLRARPVLQRRGRRRAVDHAALHRSVAPAAARARDAVHRGALLVVGPDGPLDRGGIPAAAQLPRVAAQAARAGRGHLRQSRHPARLGHLQRGRPRRRGAVSLAANSSACPRRPPSRPPPRCRPRT